MNKIILLILLSTVVFACSNIKPTPEQIANGDYGTIPTLEEMNSSARYLLRKNDDYDPSNAIIENCVNLGQGWQAMNEVIVFGYKVKCDINSKNLVGGYAGFKSKYFFMRNGTGYNYSFF